MLSMFGIKDYALAALGVVLVVTVMWYKGEVAVLELDKANLETEVVSKQAALDLQNQAIEALKVDYESKLAESKVTKTEIQTRYKVVYNTIEKFVKDENATDCDNLRKFAGSIVW